MRQCSEGFFNLKGTVVKDVAKDVAAQLTLCVLYCITLLLFVYPLVFFAISRIAMTLFKNIIIASAT